MHLSALLQLAFFTDCSTREYLSIFRRSNIIMHTQGRNWQWGILPRAPA